MKRSMIVAFTVVLSLSLSSVAVADEVAGARHTAPAEQLEFPPPPLLAQGGPAAAVIASVDAISENDLETLRHWNASGQVPKRIGVVRDLDAAYAVKPGPSAMSGAGPWHWRGSLRVADGHRLRLKLTDVRVPEGTIFWVYGGTEAPIGFDTSLMHDGTIWTPSIEGDAITLEVQSPNGAATSFKIAAFADIRSASEVIATAACIKDAKCYNGLDELASTVAHMQYASGSKFYICSGGLVIDMQQTFTPYFITANHCISTPAEAASLETFWDYRTASCNGPAPSLSGLVRTKGSTLLATMASADVSLLRLNAKPAAGPSGNRFYLGWTTTPPVVGDTLYRLSHPDGQPLRLSLASVETTSSTCAGTPRTHYIYSKPTEGAVIGGSSGSPVLNANGQVVGALSGGCPGGADPCGTVTRTVDGSFSAGYATVFKPYLNPGTTQCGSCTPGPNTACLLGGRFKVTLTWVDHFSSLAGNGSVIRYAENLPEIHPQHGPMSEVAFFSFYSFAPKSVETLVRMINGVGLNDKYWVFLAGFTGAEYNVTVVDTATCRTWTRTIASGATNTTKDFEAFPLP